ncbi:uncharacterized protein LOC131235676 [Magnolia sinica]|uniref:uncharacterized protein LOC131235676 n=1 Tax=Magnolia sinica TaxID=86752 RepID=UPI002658711D|nr:uncharacterized protein LOC131235676 [Magnolia sinica]
MKEFFPIVIFFFCCRRIALSIDPLFEACEPRDCGNGLYIRYPFRILDQPSYCGYKGFELDCKNGRPVLNMSNNDHYYIQNIFYENQTLLLVNMGLLDSETCLRPTHNLTVENRYFSVSSATTYLFFFFNCLISLPDRIGYERVYTMDCMNNDIHHSYATLADYQTVKLMNFTKDHETLSSMSFTETCESWATEPVRADPEFLYGYSEAGNYSEILKTGFVLDYGSASNCNGCVESGGQCGFNDTMSQIMCLCPDRPQLGACPADNEKRRKIRKIIIGAFGAAGGIFLVCLIFFLSRVISSITSGQKFWLDNLIFIWKKRTKDAHNVEEFLKNYGSLILQRYRYSEIKKITNSFKDKLGQGGYGGVFKGTLFDGRLVAVKVLNETKGNGEEFINEVASIGRTYHVNIVTLLGFCSEGSKRALIYDFMPNGSLEKFIYAEKPRTTNHTLGWEKLYQIAVGIARGLEYLHRGCSTRILHFDIKPHNILLDQDFCPKISDFGLAKLCPTKDSIISMLGARGTVGYIAPEVFCRNFGGVSYKSDVYSYGMMVLEMVGGRRNIDAGVENTSEIYFPQWIYKRLDLNNDLLLHGIATQVEEETARKMIIVGLWCIQTHPTNRPTISRAVEMLEGSLESLPMPPDPVLSSPSRPESQSSTTTCASKMVPLFSPSILVEMIRPDGSSSVSVLNGESLSADLAHELMGIQAASHWLHIVPWGIRKLARYMKYNNGDPPIIITENGIFEFTASGAFGCSIQLNCDMVKLEANKLLQFISIVHTNMSQQLQGTTRPTHYHVLLDEIGFSPDDLRELAHSLSYVYQRSTTAISIESLQSLRMQSHHLLSSILSFSFFLLVFHVPTSSSQADNPNDICAPFNFRCGEIDHTIKYPFWVDGRSRQCAFPGYNFTCQDNSLMIQMPSETYIVKNIDYQNNILTIVDTDFVNQTCPISTNTTIEYGYFNPTDQVRNLTLYYNCITSIEPSGFRRLPCFAEPNKFAYFTVQTEFDMLDTFADCAMSVISIHETNVGRLEDDPRVFRDVLQDGFNVSWIVGNIWCKQCVSSGGRCGFMEGLFAEPTCYCKDGVHTTACPGIDNEKRRRNIRLIVIGVSGAAGGIFLVCLFFFLSRVISSITSRQKFWLDNPIFIWKKRTKDAHNVEEFLKNYGSLILQRYRYSEIKKITNSFKDKLGQGGYGGVFKGKLFDGRLVAVKVLNETKGNGEEFINEVASIGRTYHVNIVTLLGFCSEGSKRALIYDFMPNGSLEKFIYAEKPRTTNHTLCWEKLYQIAVGIARGLEYLHRGCSMRILHFDIKPHNILLDQDFCPKISDFGLAKLCPTKDSIISMLGARGTVGYIAPEVFCRNFGGVSYKSDVYSYGMMVLEMVGGRRNFDAGVENTSEIYFPQWIYKRLDLNKDLLLHGISTQVEEETARKMIIVGLWCVQTHPTNRPTISRVVEMLEGSLESLPMPPDPVLSSPSRPELEFSTTT